MTLQDRIKKQQAKLDAKKKAVEDKAKLAAINAELKKLAGKKK